ncbi:glycosyltransferase family 2 protein [Providencia rettgeri]|uniref:glycosyltransferase family 2 protein n=1 Tax=Providencia rettgeri TaxID=587 RepID=UPI0018C5A3D4|nr:glycosyltransferase family 2 protein [Providencia rettgeri]MBG5932668.1 glycosyltransferase family 2 protein [Providencia rettgeri]MCG5372260.1 glycosyltransferase family 2 protein [Providencia rettgeri]HEM8127139.1 glycosyltransferase family 2 protein [Providencia rettgeri]
MELVSVIMPIYNSERFLDSSINSVINQTYKNWELILIDDCSSDDSILKAKLHCANDSRIKLILLNKNSGAATARNKGIELSRGKYIAFLDSDDIWFPNKLEDQITFMQNSNTFFCYTAYKKIDEHCNDIITFGVPPTISYRDLLKNCVIGCLTVVFDAEKLGKIYMPLDTKREDYALWLKIMREKNISATGLNTVLASYRVYNGQSSSKKLKMAKENWILLRKQEKLIFYSASYYFLHYTIRGILRDKFPRAARILGVLAIPDDSF